MIKNFCNKKTFSNLISLAERLLSSAFFMASNRDCEILIKSASLSDDMKSLTVRFVPCEENPNSDFVWHFNVEYLLNELEESGNEN